MASDDLNVPASFLATAEKHSFTGAAKRFLCDEPRDPRTEPRPRLLRIAKVGRKRVRNGFPASVGATLRVPPRS
jgi:hypothetical protein